MARAAKKQRQVWFWTSAACVAVGYAAALAAARLLRPERLPLVVTGLAVAGSMLLAGRRGGLLRGALTGLVVSVSVWMGSFLAVYNPRSPGRAEDFYVLQALLGASVVLCSTVAGAIFGLLAERRRRLMEHE